MGWSWSSGPSVEQSNKSTAGNPHHSSLSLLDLIINASFDHDRKMVNLNSLQSASRVAVRLSARQQFQAEKKPRRIAQLLVGLAGYGAALTLLVRSGLGASSWNVLSEGVAVQLHVTFGLATILTALVVLPFWIPLRELPGLGTILNVLLVGSVSDAVARILPTPTSLTLQIAYFAFGLLSLTFFDALYLGARFGSGPRDGLMTGLVRATGRPVWMVRTAIELTVVIIGWLLGGSAGWGTLVIALAMGPLVQQFLRFATIRLRVDSETVVRVGQVRQPGGKVSDAEM
jgi:uncharacterized membrane protein YczE